MPNIVAHTPVVPLRHIEALNKLRDTNCKGLICLGWRDNREACTDLVYKRIYYGVSYRLTKLEEPQDGDLTRWKWRGEVNRGEMGRVIHIMGSILFQIYRRFVRERQGDNDF